MGITYRLRVCMASPQAKHIDPHCSNIARSIIKTLPFVASIEHVKNTNLVIQCEECRMWRLVYAKKLSEHRRRELEKMLQTFDFSCGASTLDLDQT